MAKIGELIASGDMDGIQTLLATANVKLVPITETEEESDSHGNTDSSADGSKPTT